MKYDKQIAKQVQVVKDKCDAWINYTKWLGNQCAYIDRMLEEVIEEAQKLSTLEKKQYAEAEGEN